jgi:DNA-binding response OmpR family regulator
MNRATVLIADADRNLRQQLARFLVADGFAVAGASTENRLRSGIRVARPDIIVLGDLPGAGTNARLIEQLRRGEITGQRDATPVLVLADDDDDALALTRCFLAGADDFRAKPIGQAELTARLLAILRRGPRLAPADTDAPKADPAPVDPAPATIDCEALTIDRMTLSATFDGMPLSLTRMELALLAALAVEPARVKTKNELLRDVWGYRTIGQTRTVDAHACRLRRKLAAAGATGWVVSVRGVGYRLIDSLDDAPQPDAAA